MWRLNVQRGESEIKEDREVMPRHGPGSLVWEERTLRDSE